MHIAIDSMSSHVANLDLDIVCTKSVLFSICPSALRREITNFVCVLNSRLYSFLQASKALKFNSLVGPLPVSVNNHTNSPVQTNLVVTIPPDLTLSDPHRTVLVKGLKFVPSPGSLDLFS